MSIFNKPPVELIDMMRRAGSNDPKIAYPAQYELAQAISLPLEEALLADDIINGIYQTVDVRGSADLNYPMDILNPGDEGDFEAYVNPGNGRIPERQVQADYVHLRTYMIANSIDTLLRIVRDANWDIFGRMVQVLRSGFQMKMNRDGWHTLLASASSRSAIIYDSANTTGVFTRRLFSLLNIEMRRNGGKFTATNRRKLTHIYMSPECVQDIYNWDVNQIDEVTRRELYVMAGNGTVPKLGNTFLVDIDELGVDQEYNDYFITDLAQALPGSDTEIVVGMDLTNPSFVMPIRENLLINNDEGMHRSQKVGLYGWFEGGYAALDNRDVVVGSV